MITRTRRGSASYELALNVTLFLSVATVGWVSPSAFHDAILGSDELPVVVDVAAMEPGVAPAMLRAPGSILIPLRADQIGATHPAAVNPACASGASGDPWVRDACADPGQTPEDAKPWAATPWGAE